MNVFSSLWNNQPVSVLLKAICDDPETFIGVAENPSGRILFVNQPGAEMFGYRDAKELTGVHWNTLIKHPPPGKETVFPEEVFAGKRPWAGEVEFISPSGRMFCGYLSLASFVMEETICWLIKIRDIDSYKKIESNLQREKQRFEALFNYATMGIAVANQQGEIVLVNNYALKEFGYRESDLIGKKVEQLIPPRFQQHHTSYRNAYNHHPETRPMGAGRDLFARRKDSTEFPVEISLSPYQTEEGLFIIAFIIDISVRKEKEEADKKHREEITRVNEAIRKLNDELEIKVTERTRQLEQTLQELKVSRDEISLSLEKEKELNDMKSRFVSMASHEFRTPLSTILSSASLLAKYTQTEEQPKRDKHVQRIKSSVNNLTGILNEFLSIGRIEDGKLEARFTDFNLAELLTAVCTEIEEMKKTGQMIRYRHEGKEQVNLDMELLRNVLINLLSNAIKFSPENTAIKVYSIVREDHSITISIKDGGMGISAEDQEHLFERFFRAKNVVNIQGTGLGLHIVGKYMELMRGNISCISELNKGTEFILNFKRPSRSPDGTFATQ